MALPPNATPPHFPMRFASPTGRQDVSLQLNEACEEPLDKLFEWLEAAGAKPVDDYGNPELYIDVLYEGAKLTLQYVSPVELYLYPAAGSKPDDPGYTVEEFRPVYSLAEKLAGPRPSGARMHAAHRDRAQRPPNV